MVTAMEKRSTARSSWRTISLIRLDDLDVVLHDLELCFVGGGSVGLVACGQLEAQTEILAIEARGRRRKPRRAGRRRQASATNGTYWHSRLCGGEHGRGRARCPEVHSSSLRSRVPGDEGLARFRGRRAQSRRLTTYLGYVPVVGWWEADVTGGGGAWRIA